MIKIKYLVINNISLDCMLSNQLKEDNKKNEKKKKNYDSMIKKMY